ncbi:50S ribosomal protein L9 [bacterium]|jgi:large subunit ribosomal protein L9|nr:50S ribosomal protein L9 [bacterium]NBX72218.1 50S ribosomal protein L9 [bacterium]
MNIILLENMRNIGKMGQVATVTPGYARNFLIPFGKALAATAANIAFFEQQRTELESQAKQRLELAQERANKFSGLTLTVTAKSSSEGKLFGSIKTIDILQALNEKGFDVNKNEVRLDKPIREIGEYTYEVQLHPEVILSLSINVESEQAR